MSNCGRIWTGEYGSTKDVREPATDPNQTRRAYDTLRLSLTRFPGADYHVTPLPIWECLRKVKQNRSNCEVWRR